MAVSINGMGATRFWRGYNIQICAEDDGFRWETEIARLETWLEEHNGLPPIERIEIHDTCVLVLLGHVVYLEKTPEGLKERVL